MVAKFCSRSQGQPVPGVRNAAMISMSRPMSRDGVMGHPKNDRRPYQSAIAAATGPAARNLWIAKWSAASHQFRNGRTCPDRPARDSHKRYYGIFLAEPDEAGLTTIACRRDFHAEP